jgi:hypothetical protein
MRKSGTIPRAQSCDEMAPCVEELPVGGEETEDLTTVEYTIGFLVNDMTCQEDPQLTRDATKVQRVKVNRLVLYEMHSIDLVSKFSGKFQEGEASCNLLATGVGGHGGRR